MRITALATTLLVSVACLSAACADADNYDGGTIQVIADEAGASTLMLYISNQSFEDNNVRIEVRLDGRALIARQFAVSNQHNWIPHSVTLDAGTHTLTATSDTGVNHSATFEIADAQTRYAVLDYWYYPNDPSAPRNFSFTVQDDPVGFD